MPVKFNRRTALPIESHLAGELGIERVETLAGLRLEAIASRLECRPSALAVLGPHQ